MDLKQTANSNVRTLCEIANVTFKTKRNQTKSLFTNARIWLHF